MMEKTASNELRWFEIADLLRDFNPDWEYLVARDFSVTRVTKLYKEIFDITIERIDLGYKGYRYVPYTLYNMYDKHGRLMAHAVTLRALGYGLVVEGVY